MDPALNRLQDPCRIAGCRRCGRNIVHHDGITKTKGPTPKDLDGHAHLRLQGDGAGFPGVPMDGRLEGPRQSDYDK